MLNIWAAKCSIAELGHVLDLVFGANMTYALLLHIGIFETRLERYLEKIAELVERAQKIINAENPNLPLISMASCRTRCSNFIAGTASSIERTARQFSAAALVAAGTSVILLLVGAFWPDAAVPDVLAVAGTIMLFLPVPLGLARAHAKVTATERLMAVEYDRFFNAVELTTADNLVPDTLAQLDAIRKEMNKARPSPLARLLFWIDS